MANLLPAELLLHVLSYLSVPEDRQTLVSLCTTSKNLLECARPMLYSDLSDICLPCELLSRTLCDAINGLELGKMGKKATSLMVLSCQALTIPELGEEYSSNGARQRELTVLEERVAVLKVQSQWTQNQIPLAMFSTLQDFTFNLTTHFDGPDLVDPNFNNDLDIIPSCQSLLQIPFLNTLKHLFLDNEDLYDCSFAAFGSLITAAPNLHSLSLKGIDPAQLFEPVMQLLREDKGAAIALKAMTWHERESPWTVEDFITSMPNLFPIQHFELVDSFLDIDRLHEHGLNIGKDLRLESIISFTGTSLSCDTLETQPDWVVGLSRHFPFLQRIQTDVASNNLLPNRDTYMYLSHLILNYPASDLPVCEDIRNFLSNHPPMLKLFKLSIKGSPDDEMKLWLGEMVQMVGDRMASGENGPEDIILECDLGRKAFVKRGGVYVSEEECIMV